jgi:rRNA maturation endonuclease Nob1
MARILIIDTGVILHAKQIFWNMTARFITVPGVLEEIIDQKNLVFLDQLRTQKLLEIIPPKNSDISFVRNEALNHLGESKNLSETDLSLIALAFE